MYNWRNMTDAQRADVLRQRQLGGQPWHGPPHGLEKHWHHISAACFEHAPFLGSSAPRMAAFERDLVQTLNASCQRLIAWCVLPNHYHALVQCVSVPLCRQALGKMHGRSSRG